MKRPSNIRDLLLAPTLEAEAVAALLVPFGIREIKKADANLQSIAGDPPERRLFAEILEEALIGFSESPLPDQALNNFERFSKTVFSKTHFFSYLQASPRSLHQLAFVLGASPFLADILIRNPEYFYWVFSLECLAQPKGKAVFRKELGAALRPIRSKKGRLDMLRIFKRKEILRIGVRDLLRKASVAETLRELSSLADALIEQAYAICERALRRDFGKPLNRETGKPPAGSGFTVLALGKLGSRELNFSSDVDLIYVYASGAGTSAGTKDREGIDCASYYERLAKDMTAALNDRTEQGYVYRVDLRLRPEGDAGRIALPMEGYRLYYQKRGEIWERLALLRARVAAGDKALGRAFLELAADFVYRPFGPEGLADVRACKAQIDDSIASDRLARRDVKRGFGGIREIEFIVQSLALFFGSRDLSSGKINTMEAIRRMRKQGHLSKTYEGRLRAAYLFLRDLENKLQMENDRQTHVIPATPAEMEVLAQGLGYAEAAGRSAGEGLKADLDFHTRAVHDIFQEIFSPRAASAH